LRDSDYIRNFFKSFKASESNIKDPFELIERPESYDQLLKKDRIYKNSDYYQEEEMPSLLQEYMKTLKLPLEGEWFSKTFINFSHPIHDKIDRKLRKSFLEVD